MSPLQYLSEKTEWRGPLVRVVAVVAVLSGVGALALNDRSQIQTNKIEISKNRAAIGVNAADNKAIMRSLGRIEGALGTLKD